ncbi:hypothetical protein [Streptomyces sp. NPDC096030]|uniref:hypothetical protein n=1 Tax=Streptomyces sp. NPDC096030 TaxID=3155423 RepID=UPI0033339088
MHRVHSNRLPGQRRVHIELNPAEIADLIADLGDDGPYDHPATDTFVALLLAAHALFVDDEDNARDAARQAAKVCRCPHPADEHSVYGCEDGCTCEWMPKRAARQAAGQPAAEPDVCPTPETHNWGCGCPTDQKPGRMLQEAVAILHDAMTHGVTDPVIRQKLIGQLVSACRHVDELRSATADQPAEETPDRLTHVGWWCWRGNPPGHLATQACRSDNVPIHVPAEWADDMIAVFRRLEDGDDEPDAAVGGQGAAQTETPLTDAERQFLTFALDAAEHDMEYSAESASDENRAALARFRRRADGSGR